MTFSVRFSPTAEADLERLFDFLLSRAETVDDLSAAPAAIDAVHAAVSHQLAITPYSFRKIGRSPTRRELIIPFKTSGYIALYEIASARDVVVLAVRHQREEDYH